MYGARTASAGREEDLLRDDCGQGLVEYAIIIALIAVVSFIGVRGLGNGSGNVHSVSATATKTAENR